SLLPVCDDRVGLYQPRDARPETGNAHPRRSLLADRVSVISKRHRRRDRCDGRPEPAEGRNAEPQWLHSGSSGVSPGTKTQLVVSANGCGHRADEMLVFSPATKSISWPVKILPSSRTAAWWPGKPTPPRPDLGRRTNSWLGTRPVRQGQQQPEERS